MPRISDAIDWQSRARSLKPRGAAVINGQRVAAIGGEIFASVSPIDGRKLALVAAGEVRDIELHAFDKYTELKTTWIDLA
jgi:gamma-glutamyl-gamma-aminobutyraldehyde dehydrogenase